MLLNSFPRPFTCALMIGCIALTSGSAIAKDGSATGPKGGVSDKYRVVSADDVRGGIASVQDADNIGPKGGDTRKGVHIVSRTLAGAAFPVTTITLGWFIGPKGGDVRKGIY